MELDDDIAFHTLAIGPWEGPTRGQTIVVVRGFLLRETTIVGGRGACQVFGPDDVLPVERDPEETRSAVRWQALTEVRHGTVDVRHVLAGQRRSVVATLLERATGQLDQTAQQLAIMQLTRVEDRIAALYWLFARRWGIATPDGLLVELPFRHDVIGRLVGARRSTVSAGLTELARRGVLVETTRGVVLAFDGDPDFTAV